VPAGDELVVMLNDALIVNEKGLVATALLMSVHLEVTGVGPPVVGGVLKITPYS